MNLKSNDNAFNAYNGNYIDITVNGVIKKFLVKRAPLDTNFSEYTMLNPISDIYSIIGVSSDQTCE